MSSISERVRSFRYAFRGIRLLWAEPNARIHLAITAAVVVLGLWLRVSASGWGLLLLAIGMVLAAEAFNTAIENLADRVQPEQDPLIARTKDLAAGAVLITAVAAAGVGLLVLGPPLLRRLLGG
jgi:diacylglycerol kinase (ATP)